MDGIGNAEAQEARWRKALRAGRARHPVVEAQMSDQGRKRRG